MTATIKCIALFCALIGFNAAFAQPIFFPVRSTPYDHQMARIQYVLASNAKQIDSTPPINLWMMQLRAMPYHYSRYWQTPLEVTAAQASDCKGKAIALYARLHESGVHNLRIVIGKRLTSDPATHAWLEWQTTAGSYVLDPTFNETPARVSEIDPATYIPHYAFDEAHKYRAFNGSSLASSATAIVPAFGDRVYLSAQDRQSHSRPTHHHRRARTFAAR